MSSADYFTTSTKALNGMSVSYSFENVKAQALVEDTNINTQAGIIPEIASGQPIYKWYGLANSFMWEKIIPNIGYYGGMFAGEPNTTPKVMNNLNNKSTNPNRVPFVWPDLNYTSEFVGVPFNQDISGQIIYQEAYNIPHDISDGGLYNQLYGNGNIHSFVCAWDFANYRYSSDTRYYYTDLSRIDNPTLYGGTNVKNWANSGVSTEKPGRWDGAGADGITCVPNSWSYFSTTVEGIKKIKDLVVWGIAN